MARGSPTVPRSDGLGPAAVIAVLLAVLTALLLPPPYGSTEPRMPDRVASAFADRVVSAFADRVVSAFADRVVSGAEDRVVSGAEDRVSAAEVAQAGSGARADGGNCAALLRSPRDVPGERLSPPSLATVASHRRPVSPPSPVHTASSAAVSPLVSPPASGRHQGRAPPPPPGT